MVRRGQSKQSLNTSVTVVNNSIAEESFEYAEFIKRFDRPDLETEPRYPIIPSQEPASLVRQEVENLVASTTCWPGFVLLSGPMGTGKTTVVRRLAQEYSSKITFFYVNACWVLMRKFGDPERSFVSLFDEAIQKSPSLIFIDKFDKISQEKKLMNIIEDRLELLDQTASRVLVVATTSKPESLDYDFDRTEIKFTLPSKENRIEVMKSLAPKLTDEELDKIAESTHCYSFRDLNLLCKTTSKLMKDLNLSNLEFALKDYKPLAIKTVITPCAPLYWHDIGGVEDVKEILQELVIWPLRNKQKFTQLGGRPNKGALLYGPPGCAKTMLARALATESGFRFINIKGPEILTKYVGDSEAQVRKLYRNARELAPCIIFFDEFDGLAQTRNDNKTSNVSASVLTQLLVEIDGIEPLHNVFTLAATNRIDRIDSAMIRPGRLYPTIHIPLPSLDDRKAIFRVQMKDIPYKLDIPVDDAIGALAEQASGFSGADITSVCQRSLTLAIRESLDHVELRHLETAMEERKQGADKASNHRAKNKLIKTGRVRKIMSLWR